MPASYNPQDISDCSVLKTQWQPTPLSLMSVNLCQRFVSRLFCSVHNSWYNGHSDIMYVHIWRSQLWKQILFVFEGADFLLWQNDILILVIFECHHFRSVINGWRICVLLYHRDRMLLHEQIVTLKKDSQYTESIVTHAMWTFWKKVLTAI